MTEIRVVASETSRIHIDRWYAWRAERAALCLISCKHLFTSAQEMLLKQFRN